MLDQNGKFMTCISDPVDDTRCATSRGHVITTANGLWYPKSSTIFGSSLPTTKEWWIGKATAYATAWGKVFPGESPTVHNVRLGLAVAIHETWAGDAWVGEHNWGAVQKRGLTAQEKVVLTGLPPSPANVAFA